MNHIPVWGRTRGFRKWIAGLVLMALIVGVLSTWCVVNQACAKQGGEKPGERPILFLGNESLPPMNFMKNGRPTGIVIDIAKALAERMHHPVDIRLINWTEAQRLVQDGQADALLQINPDPERLKIYDFSKPLLTSEFSIFTAAGRLGITSMSDLRGLKVGAEAKGLPTLLLQKDPLIILKIIPNFVQSFNMLATGAVDAVVADRWVGSYVLAENNIRGVKLIEEPIGRSDSGIAVKKGNNDLLTDINAALDDIRRDGTYERIIKAWQPEDVVFETRGQLRQQIWFFAAISVALIVALISVAVLVREIRRRKRFESTLRDSEERLRLFIEHAPASLAMFDREMRYLSASRRWLSDYNLEERDLIGMSHYEVFPEIPEYWKEVHRRGLAGEVVQADDDRFDRADGSVQWLRWEIRPWHDSAGAVAGIVIFTEDITERKLAEATLRESRELLRAVTEGSPDPIFLKDRQGRFIMANSALFQFWGKPMEEVIGKNDCELFEDPAFGETIMANDRMVMQSGVTHVIEEVVLSLEGGLRTYLSTKTPFRNGNGEIVGILGVVRDITERKQMEEELRKSRDELELRVQERTNKLVQATEELKEKAEIIDFAHDAIIMRDSVGKIIFWSKGAHETYGFSNEEALGKVSHELLNASFPLPLETITSAVLEKGEWKGEIKHTRANGERIVVDTRWAIQVGGDGQPAGFLEVNRDITARKIAEEEFRKADRAFRTLSEFNQAMVRQTDEMELLQQVCRIVADVGGYRLVWVGFAENDENKSIVPIASAGYDYGYLDQARISWADDERGQGPCGISIRTGKMSVSQNAESNPAFAPWRFEAAKRGIASSISLPLIVEGHVIGALGIYASEPDAFDEGEASLLNNLAENLSYGIASIRLAEQRRQSQEELRVYASRLEMINKELQDFAFAAAHDLQEPLRKIQTFCDLAVQRCAPVLDNTSKDYLDRVINSASRMRELLHELLEFSEVAAIPEPFEKIDLMKIAREAADIFEASVKETGCRIEIENMPAIEADENQMLRLFQNLIGNALKFRSDETPHIKIYSKSNRKGTWEIFVKDNGIGFEQRYAERIFKPFQKLHGRGEYEGVGMGLTVCRKIVERHSGTIRAESELGRGSTFIIRMPAKQMISENGIAG